MIVGFLVSAVITSLPGVSIAQQNPSSRRSPAPTEETATTKGSSQSKSSANDASENLAISSKSANISGKSTPIRRINGKPYITAQSEGLKLPQRASSRRSKLTSSLPDEERIGSRSESVKLKTTQANAVKLSYPNSSTVFSKRASKRRNRTSATAKATVLPVVNNKLQRRHHSATAGKQDSKESRQPTKIEPKPETKPSATAFGSASEIAGKVNSTTPTARRLMPDANRSARRLARPVQTEVATLPQSTTKVRPTKAGSAVAAPLKLGAEQKPNRKTLASTPTIDDKLFDANSAMTIPSEARRDKRPANNQIRRH